MSKLVIVESPSKAKTIKKYLGEGYEVVASNGHIRDLPKSKFGVDVDNNFTPLYENVKDKADLIKSLQNQAKKSETVFLATDPDREGEAISWHLAQILQIDVNKPTRVTFNEITKTGIKHGMENPRSLDIDLINAQQARRILDRVVGYKLSPFLWKKVRRGLSAGRVQSVAVRLIVDRENEIEKFKEKEYWSIDAKLTASTGRKIFSAKFVTLNGKKYEINDEEHADEILAKIGDNKFIVKNVKKSVRKKASAPPFTTSTLQQEASRKLSFQSRRTMKAAQELYEGVELPNLGAVGLITYMRTDSLRVSDEARTAAAEYIEKNYGKDYVPAKPKEYKQKNNSQDAHEAIRPADVNITPQSVKSSLSADQYKLYKLIWERFVASQMENALLDTVSIDIDAGECGFKASGYTVKFDGFTKLYEEGKDVEDEEGGALPEIKKDEVLKVKGLEKNQHFTQPPARYTEATLIKALEENGIGRPSTYAPTISTILSRSYIERDGKALKPTPLGDVTTQLMKDHFDNIVDAKFTAKMESELDNIEGGKSDWIEIIRVFYNDFFETLTTAEKNMEGKRVKVPEEVTDEVCEVCGKNMSIKIGPFGKFLGCTGFPDCKNTKKIVNATKGNCPICGKKMLAKKSRKGKPFYGCESYKECNFMTWDIPVEDKCPKCGCTMFKKGGKNGKIYCLKPECGFEKPFKEAENSDDE